MFDNGVIGAIYAPNVFGERNTKDVYDAAREKAGRAVEVAYSIVLARKCHVY